MTDSFSYTNIKSQNNYFFLQLNLLTRLLLQKIFSLSPNSNLLRYTCTTLALLCNRYELRKTVFAILTEKADEIKSTHPVAFLTLINSMGGDAVADFFCPNVDYFLMKAQEDIELKFELLVRMQIYGLWMDLTCFVLCCAGGIQRNI